MQGLLPDIHAVASAYLLSLGRQVAEGDALFRAGAWDTLIPAYKRLARQAPESSVFARLAHAQSYKGNMTEAVSNSSFC